MKNPHYIFNCYPACMNDCLDKKNSYFMMCKQNWFSELLDQNTYFWYKLIESFNWQSEVASAIYTATCTRTWCMRFSTKEHHKDTHQKSLSSIIYHLVYYYFTSIPWQQTSVLKAFRPALLAWCLWADYMDSNS